MDQNIKKEIDKFVALCYKPQMDLKKYLKDFLLSNRYKVIDGDGFLYAKGKIPYLVTAHMDTVHKVQCSSYVMHSYKGKTRIQSKDGIGGDDRCGIYMITKLIRDGYRPSVLFCEDEEIGSVGASKFCKTKYINDLREMKYLIELDRANENDAVFYDCDNPAFTRFITETTGYVEAQGSFTDIVELSDACEIASVNLSCGYYKQHTVKEYVLFEEMLNTIEVVKKLLDIKDCDQYEFIPRIYYRDSRYYIDESYYRDLYGSVVVSGMEIGYLDPKTNKEVDVTIGGESEAECMYNFFLNNPDICWNDIIDYYIY